MSSIRKIPIAAAMILKGLSPGAALVFLMTGPATNAAGLATIWHTLGRRTAVLYLLTVAGCALAFGSLVDAVALRVNGYLRGSKPGRPHIDTRACHAALTPEGLHADYPRQLGQG